MATGASLELTITEYTDPACGWAWGSEPTLRRLRLEYGGTLRWRRVMGALVVDNAASIPDYDPERLAVRYREFWAGLSAVTGMPHPGTRLVRMLTSSVPACVAVKAAERQGDDQSGRVLRRLRESLHVFGALPETPATIGAAARGVPGLDEARLGADLGAAEVRAAAEADFAEARLPNDFVRSLVDDRPGNGMMKQTDGVDRFAFPTLVVRGRGGEATIAGWNEHAAYVEALERVAPGSTATPAPLPSPADALARFGTLAAAELDAWYGDGAGQEPPAPTARCFTTPRGPFWLAPSEAAARSLS